jgi:3-(3-hydroxy-phenyl)propionate hydroxylase
MTRDQGRIQRAVVYRFHATIAPTFRRGRVFLAGDAAHQTPPFMGQGLCTGARDAENLVWKIAAVERGRASEALLDTYTEERHPAAVAMVQHSTNAGKLIEAFAEMSVTGRPPPPELVAYGYGGGKLLPGLTRGLLVHGASEWVGRLVPQCEVSAGGSRGRFDDLAGPGFAVVGLGDPRSILNPADTRAWEALDAAFLELSDPAARTLLGEGEILIVRPDRVVYSLGAPVGPPGTLFNLARIVQS